MSTTATADLTRASPRRYIHETRVILIPPCFRGRINQSYRL